MTDTAPPERTRPEPVPAYSWYALGVLALVYLLNFVDRQILSILANDIKADLGLDDAQLGFLYGTAFAIFYALFGIPLGRLADSGHRLRLLSLGLALWSAMTVLSGFARNAADLTLARVGVGVGEASANPCAYSLIADWFPARLRATAISIYSAGLFLGSGLSLVLGGAIVDRWNAAWPLGGPLGLVGWQAAFIAVGAPGLLLALWVLSLREPARGQQEGAGAQPVLAESRPLRQFGQQVLEILPPFTLVAAGLRGPRALAQSSALAGIIALVASALAWLSGNVEQFLFLGIGYYAVLHWALALRDKDPATFRMTWGSPAFMAIVLAYACVSFVGYAATYWAAPFAERQFPVSKAELGWLLGAPAAVGGFAGVIAGGWLADRLHRRRPSGRLLVILIALLAPAPLMITGYTSASLTVFAICAFLVQMATASALGAAAAASQALVLPQMRGTATAIFLLGATLVGLGLGPFTAGFVSEASGQLATGVLATLVASPLGCLALLLAARHYARPLTGAGSGGA